MNMKSLGRTIDQILKVDPNLDASLTPIKNKAKKYPSRTTSYWKELLDVLNSDPMLAHPKRKEIRDILTYTRKAPETVYTFETVKQGERILGVIPEDVSDRIRRHDRKAIWLAKKQVEANMTRNVKTMAIVAREETLLEISARKMWLQVKDHFKLWENPTSYTIKRNESNLVLVGNPPQRQPRPMIMPMDPNMLRGLLGGMMGPDSEE